MNLAWRSAKACDLACSETVRFNVAQMQPTGTRRVTPIGARQLTQGFIREAGHIAVSDHFDAARSNARIALAFPAGARPSVASVEAVFAQPAAAAIARISSNRGQGEGWLELLSSGLTFDVAGLAPAPPFPLPVPRHHFGLPRDCGDQGWEACVLAPGPHLAHAGAMEPVVRAMAALASQLATGLGAAAVCWQPAASYMDINYFARIVEAWCNGGVFPALGFSGMTRLDDGSVASEGLAFFTGQELRVEPRPGESPSDTVKLAVRLADRLVREGPIQIPGRLTGPEAEALFAEPSADGRQVRLRRQG